MAPVKLPTRKDKIEYAPTSQAKCRGCGQKIVKGTQRAGIETYSPRYENFTCYYDHGQCVPQGVELRLDRSPDDELAHQNKEKVEMAHKVRERADLREALRQLRLHFAQRLQVSPFIVFHNTVLDQLTVHMPKNRSEFLSIHGMGPKKYQSFGDPILHVIHHYRRLYQQSERQQDNKRGAKPPPVLDTDDHRDGFSGVKTLSCEEIVRQKFEDAESNGYVIEI